MSYPKLKGAASLVLVRARASGGERAPAQETRHDEKIIRTAGNDVPEVSLVTLFHRIPL